MGKIGIIYATKTKHSEKYAGAIGKALNVKAENISGKPSLESLDLLFIVGGIYSGKSLPELLEYVRGLDSEIIKSAALVTSNVSGKYLQDEVRGILEEKGIKVIDEIMCPGTFLLFKIGHPNAADLQTAVDFAKRISGEKE
jgi:flavodoxin